MAAAQNRMGMNIKRLRAEHGITQTTLAKKANLSLGYVARLEIGMHDPPLSTLAKIAKVLRVKIGQLVD
jgi:transcriptional regulator with XRE-family HTH domain